MIIKDGRRQVHDLGAYTSDEPAQYCHGMRAQGLLSILTGEAHSRADSGGGANADHERVNRSRAPLEKVRGFEASLSMRS